MEEGGDDGNEESKTEDPSPQRLEQAFEQGDLPMSHDFISVVSMCLGLIVIFALLPSLTQALVTTIRSFEPMTRTQDPAPMLRSMGTLRLPVLGLALAGTVGALAASLGQTGGRLFPDKLAPDFGRLMSFQAITHAFTKAGVSDIFLAVVKLTVVLAATVLPSTDEIVTLTRLILATSDTQAGAIATLLSPIAMRGALVLALVAGLDLGVQRYRWFQKKKMTKAEVKREMKNDEGDPHIKGRRRQIARKMARRKPPQQTVPKADAVIVNPTHIAIAIRYRKGEHRAPIVIAKGKGVTADTIRALAREHQVPIVKDIPLARLLHKKCEIGREVPMETFKAVAAVLAFVSKITGRPPGTGP
ncbi:MAG: EscU/YscU/HrcU family type III secretion system export apparatus switch protein [Deltaproteobacteria bacterium]|nr:EscU/YscU/HrcU family type III secretion system export apparatus switch protein [Deltaproteobacteria bacterium]